MRGLCERCETAPARPNICGGDGRYHHHGMVHTPDGKLQDVCRECSETLDREWKQGPGGARRTWLT